MNDAPDRHGATMPAPETDPAAPFLAALEKTARADRHVDFWWRDDDAVHPTPALDRLLDLAQKHAIPLALAVIPADAQRALARRIADQPLVTVLQHGWRHARHNPPEAKKAEFGDHRPIDLMMAEIDAGTDRLRSLFGKQRMPVFVPPWNRIGPNLATRLAASRDLALSTHAPRLPSKPGRIDTHCDIIAWRTTRSAVPPGEAFTLLAEEVERRLQGASAGPIGVLSHHLVHDEPICQLLETILATIAASPAARWPEPAALFARRHAAPGR